MASPQLARRPSWSSPSVSEGHDGPDAAAPQPDDVRGVGALVRALLRHWLLVGFLAALGLGLGLTAGLLRTDQYSATASVLLGAPRPQFLEFEAAVGAFTVSKDTIANEIELLRSRKLAQEVVNDLSLHTLREFQPADDKQAEGVRFWVDAAKERLKGVVQAVRIALGGGEAGVTDGPPSFFRDPAEDVVDIYLERLDIGLRGQSQVLDITFMSEDPDLAARVANTASEYYLADRMSVRTQAASRTNEWYEDRLVALRRDLQEREAAVDRFREETGLVEGAKATLSAEQFSLLNEQLLQARTELAQAEARFESARSSGLRGGLADVQNSVNVQNLRLEETRLQAELGENSRVLGERHPRMIELRERLAAVQADLRREVGGIVSGLQAEVEVQRDRVAQLEDSIKRLEQRIREGGGAEAQLRVLVREAEAARTLYEEALRHVEVSAPVAEVESSDARIISAAVVPRNPAGPSSLMLGTLGLVLGGFCGSAAAFALELRNARFKNATEAEALTQLRVVGIMPPLRSIAGAPKRFALEEHVIVQPDGPFAEIMRVIRNQISVALHESPTKRIMVTSSIKGEGKTLTSVSLARSFARSGRSTVLVDGDLRLGRIEAAMRLPRQNGLGDYLAGKPSVASTLAQDPLTELQVIGKGSPAGSVGDLLDNGRLKRLFRELAQHFEVIIVDTPPLLPVADAAFFLESTDLALLVVDWNRTEPHIVEAASARLRELALDVSLGIILNNVDPRRASAAGFHELKIYYDRRYGSTRYYRSDHH